MSKAYKISTSIGLTLLAFCLACRAHTPLADFYSLKVYPVISALFSWISSITTFSLQDIAITAIVATAISVVILSVHRQWGWKRCLRYELTLLLWTYVWFYMSWCNNYSRSSIFNRTSTELAQHNDSVFKDFIYSFADNINAAWTHESTPSQQELEKEVKDFYNSIPQQYGLAKPKDWQHPKWMTVSRAYSAVGVQGFMAPLLSESFINADVLPADFPFVYAHEYSHLLGISSEAEANWWAFHACISSNNQAVQYSGYRNILPHVIINASNLLSEEDFTSWASTIRPEVLKDRETYRQHWMSLHSPLLNDIQDAIYDLFLKSNKVSSGKKNYSEVIQLLISLHSPHENSTPKE